MIMADPSPHLARLLDALRHGDLAAKGEVLRRYHPWLLLLARVQIDSQLRGKLDPADIVQQALLEACRDFAQDRGRTEAELMAWLRQILAHVLAHEIRRYRGTKQRDLAREVSLEQALAQSSQRLGEVLAGPQSSPSQQAARHEEEMLLADVLARLPDDYRGVLVLPLEGLAHDEIAPPFGRTSAA